MTKFNNLGCCIKTWNYSSLQVGQDAPHPSPDPVALTIAPARIEELRLQGLQLLEYAIS